MREKAMCKLTINRIIAHIICKGSAMTKRTSRSVHEFLFQDLEEEFSFPKGNLKKLSGYIETQLRRSFLVEDICCLPGGLIVKYKD